MKSWIDYADLFTYKNCYWINYQYLCLTKKTWQTFSYVVFAHSTALDVLEDPFSSRQEDSSEGLNHNSVVETLLQRNRELSFTPTDNQEGVFSRPARSFITEEILEALRKADRKGRDVVVGLSNACCKWGCSKSEISSLCWESPADIYCTHNYTDTQIYTQTHGS